MLHLMYVSRKSGHVKKSKWWTHIDGLVLLWDGRTDRFAADRGAGPERLLQRDGHRDRARADVRRAVADAAEPVAVQADHGRVAGPDRAAPAPPGGPGLGRLLQRHQHGPAARRLGPGTFALAQPALVLARLRPGHRLHRRPVRRRPRQPRPPAPRTSGSAALSLSLSLPLWLYFYSLISFSFDFILWIASTRFPSVQVSLRFVFSTTFFVLRIRRYCFQRVLMIDVVLFIGFSVNCCPITLVSTLPFGIFFITTRFARYQPCKHHFN